MKSLDLFIVMRWSLINRYIKYCWKIIQKCWWEEDKSILSVIASIIKDKGLLSVRELILTYPKEIILPVLNIYYHAVWQFTTIGVNQVKIYIMLVMLLRRDTLVLTTNKFHILRQITVQLSCRKSNLIQITHVQWVKW